MNNTTGGLKRNYSHKQDIEERLFALDIDALRQESEEFKYAWDNNGYCELTMKLPELFEICPRKYPKTESYNRFVKFLESRGIELTITSRKKRNK